MAHNRQEGDPVRDPRQRIKLYDLQDFLLELARSPERAKMPLEGTVNLTGVSRANARP